MTLFGAGQISTLVEVVVEAYIVKQNQMGFSMMAISSILMLVVEGCRPTEDWGMALYINIPKPVTLY